MQYRAINKNSGIAVAVLLSFCIWTFGCGGISTETELTNKSNKNTPMEALNIFNETPPEINLETVSFRPPENFQDHSRYSNFIKPAYDANRQKRLVGGETEVVSAVRLTRGTKTSGSRDALTINTVESARASLSKEVEGYKDEAKKLYGARSLTIKIEVFMDKEFESKGKYPSLMTGLVMGETDKKIEYRREAFIFDTPSTFFYLKYVTTQNGAEIQKKFERMTESLELNTPDFTDITAATSDGYIRSYSGNVTLEVPVDLIPARKFVYHKQRAGEKPDPETAIILSLVEPDDQEILPKTNPEESEYNPGRAYSGRIAKRDGIEKNSRFYNGSVINYSIIRDEEYQDINPALVKKTTAIWARLEDNSGKAIILTGAAPAEKENELRAEFEKWMQTFVPASERGDGR